MFTRRLWKGWRAYPNLFDALADPE